jgi:WD40 repeat protein
MRRWLVLALAAGLLVGPAVSRGRGAEEVPLPPLRAYVPLTFAVLSPDGKVGVTGDCDGTVHVLDTATGKQVGALAEAVGRISAAAFTPDSAKLAVAGGDGVVRVLDVATGKELAKVKAGQYELSALALSPDGKTVAAGTGALKVLDVATGKEPVALAVGNGTPTFAAFSPDRKFLVSLSDGEVTLWDLATGKPTTQLGGVGHDITALAFAPDGKSLAFGMVIVSKQPGDKVEDSVEVKLWDVAARKELASLKMHTDAVDTLAFSADGKALVSVGRDGAVRLWDVAARKEQAVLKGLSGVVMAAAFSTDGKTLTTVCPDQSMDRWEAATGKHLTPEPATAKKDPPAVKRTEDEQKLRALYERRRAPLRQALRVRVNYFRVGRADLREVHDITFRLLEAELAVCDDPEERGALHEQFAVPQTHLFEKIVKLRLEARVPQKSVLDVSWSRASSLEAELGLLRERAGPKPSAEDAAKIHRLLVERRDALKPTGKERWDDREPACRALLQAELDLAAKPGERIDAWRHYLEFTEKQQEIIKMRLDGGIPDVTEADHQEAAARHLAARVGLLREEAGDRPAAEKTGELKKLLRDRRDALAEAARARKPLADLGREDPKRLLSAELAVLDAELDLKDSPADRVAILEKILKLWKDRADLLKLRLEARIPDVTLADVAETEASCLDAEINLLREQIAAKKDRP